MRPAAGSQRWDELQNEQKEPLEMMMSARQLLGFVTTIIVIIGGDTAYAIRC